MNNEFFHEKKEEPPCIYDGSPRTPDIPGESTRWKKFIKKITLWLSSKRELGDDYLEAIVMEKRAQALDKIAGAEVKHETARKIAAETAEIAERLEAKKMRNANIVTKGKLQQEFEEELDKLEEKMRLARLKYGCRMIQLPVEQESGQTTALDNE